MSSGDYFIPLRNLFSSWPEDQIMVADGDGLLDQIGISDFAVQETSCQTTVSATMVYDGEIAINLPGLAGVEIAVGAEGTRTTIDVEIDLRSPFQVRLLSVDVEIRLPPQTLKPAVMGTDGYEEDTSTDQVSISTSADITIDGSGNVNVVPEGTLSLQAFLVGDSGIAVAVTELSLDLSPTTSCDAAEAAGMPTESTGVFISSAEVQLPAQLDLGLPSSLELTNAYIGSGGLQGTVSASFSSGTASGSIAGFGFETREVSLRFESGSLTLAEVEGVLAVPFFDRGVVVVIAVSSDGSLGLRLSTEQTEDGVAYNEDTALVQLTLEGLLTVGLSSLALDIADGEWQLTLSGDLALDVGGLEWPDLVLKDLGVRSDGTITLGGGWMDLEDQAALDLGGFTVEISQLGFGRDESETWIGVSGGLVVGTGIEAGAGVDGLRVSWPTDAATDAERAAGVSVSLDGVSLRLAVAGTFTAQGYVSWADVDGDSQFLGDLELSIDSLGFGIDIGAVVGRSSSSPSFTYAYISVALDLPVGIPILSTGLGLYGGQFVLAAHMEPDKGDDSSWTDWYDTSPMGIDDPQKWTKEQGSWAIGVGMSIGTLFDLGYAFSARALCMVVLPGPTILIEGKASFLRSRTGLMDDAPLSMLAVLDVDSGELLFALDATFRLDQDSGLILDLDAGSEAFFSMSDASHWYVHIGEQTPEDHRIRATMLKLFSAEAYLEIDPDGLAAGMSCGYDVDWTFGPLKVELTAMVEGSTEISWLPPQLDATFGITGRIGLSAYGVGVGFSVSVDLGVTSPTPLELEFAVEVELNLPWPLPDLEAKATFDKTEGGSAPVPVPFVDAVVEHLKATETWATSLLPEYDTDGDGYRDTSTPSYSETDALADCPVVPVDSRVSLTFLDPLFDDANVASNAGPEPDGVEVAGTWYKYALTSVTLWRRDRSGGTFSVEAKKNSSGISTGTLYGYWQVDLGSSGEQTRLMLWTENSFEIARSNTTSSFSGSVRSMDPDYPCRPMGIAWKRADVDAYSTGTDQSDSTFPMDHASAETTGNWIVINQPHGGAGTVQRLLHNDDNSCSVTVIFDVVANGVEVYAMTTLPGGGTIEVLDGTTVLTTLPLPTNQAPATFNASRISGVRVSGTGTRLAAVRYRDLVVAQRNADIAAAQSRLQTEIETWAAQTDYVFEPDSFYKVEVQTAVRSSSSKNGTYTDDHTYTHYIYFQTEAPPGCATTAGAEGGYPLEGPLKDLGRYVDHSVPASGESAVYRGYDIGFVFNENYVELMYVMAGTSLVITLMDHDGQPVLDSEGNEVVLNNAFGKNTELSYTKSEATWKAFVSNSFCLSWSSVTTMEDDILVATTEGIPLRPEADYLATLTCDIAEVPLATVRFTTSAFVSFAHHLQSGFGDTWTLDTTVTIDAPTLEGLVSDAADLDLTDDAACRVAYEAIEEALLDEARTDLPVRVDISVITDAAGDRWAILIESSEPIAWERVSAMAAYASTPFDMDRTLGAVRLAACRLEPADRASGTYNDEWIELIAREGGSLDGWSIGLAGELDGTTPATTMVTFGATDEFEEGEVVRVYTGSSGGHTPDEGVTAVYAGLADWAFAAGGDTAFVMDADGNEVDRLPVVQESAFTDLDVVVVPSGDGTRAFVFFPSSGGTLAGQLPDGHYRLDLQYLAAPGGGLPIVRRKGEPTDEWTRLQWTLTS